MEKKIKKNLHYSDAFKQMAIAQVKAGFSLSSVSARYGIGGGGTLAKWCRLFGIEMPEKEYIDIPLRKEEEYDMIKKGDKQLSGKDNKGTEERIKLLEAELLLYKKLVEIAKRDYDLDLLKKLDTKQSGK